MRVLCELGRAGTSRDVLAEIEREVIAMDGLVGDLLAHARLDLDAVRRAPVDVVGIAREAIARHAARTDTPPIALDEAEAPRAPIAIDATLVARALDTLLENARVHAGGATCLRVASVGEAREADDGGAVALAVEDAGPGFRAEDLPALFEPFRRGTDAAGAGAGVGLGLHLVRRIAEAHGGTARAENLAPGARVVFTLATARPG